MYSNFEFQLQFETENATHVVYNLEGRPLSINIGLVQVSPNSTSCCVAHKFLVKNRKPIILKYGKSLSYVIFFFHFLKDLDQNCSQKNFCTFFLIYINLYGVFFHYLDNLSELYYKYVVTKRNMFFN